eukprot:8889201-Alexandrium_andersonii.AAC.1
MGCSAPPAPRPFATPPPRAQAALGVRRSHAVAQRPTKSVAVAPAWLPGKALGGGLPRRARPSTWPRIPRRARSARA